MRRTRASTRDSWLQGLKPTAPRSRYGGFPAPRGTGSTRPLPYRNRESGYALLFALFMILAMLAGASVAMLNLKTQGQRLREEQMIWRGEQYKRAIRLYFHKTGHYPQTIDDLQKGLPDLHFLRQAYKDPMNTGDGTWRYIYVNPSGQIIGSVKYANLQQMALLDQPGGPQAAGIPGLGTPASALNQNTSSVTAFSQITGPTNASGQSAGGTTTGGDSSGQSGQPNLQNPQNPQAGQNPQPGQNPQQSGFGQQPGGGLGLGPGPGQQGSLFGPLGQSGPGGTGNPLTDLKPTGPVDGPVLGAFLTGVGSKVDKNSFKILKGAKKYKEWEFIWNPLEDQAAAAQQAIGQGAGAPGVALPFANPGIFGNPPPGGTNPGGINPGGQQPQPQPQQPQGPQSPN